MRRHADSRQEWIARVVNAHTINFLIARDLTEMLPPFYGQPRWKIWHWGDDFYSIPGTAREMNHALMNENTLQGIGLIGIQTCERQNSQAQSREFRFVSSSPANPKAENSCICRQQDHHQSSCSDCETNIPEPYGNKPGKEALLDSARAGKIAGQFVCLWFFAMALCFKIPRTSRILAPLACTIYCGDKLSGAVSLV
jgi:hypothetical protein